MPSSTSLSSDRRPSRIARFAVAVSLSIMIAGCAATRVSVAPADDPDWTRIKRLVGEIAYSGNAAYLPRMLLVNTPDPGLPSRIVFRYAYDVSYDVPKEHELTVFNPLLIVGVSKSTDTVTVRGVLEVLKDGGVLKRYERTVALGKDKTIFSEGDTLSDMRKQGLLLVRDHIDGQLIADREFLEAHIDIR